MNMLALSTLIASCFALAHPNVLPPNQQEYLHPPSFEVESSLHLESTVRDVLLANQIIPQVLDDFEPEYYIKLAYPKHHHEVLLGNDIPVKAVQSRPIFTLHSVAGSLSSTLDEGDKNPTFTLILTDPDALSRSHPVKSEMCHWIITNLTTPLGKYGELAWPLPTVFDDQLFPEEEVYLESVSTAARKPGEVESYMPPAPPKKTGPHRYVFVLLEGDTSNANPPKERAHWGYGKERHGVRDWAAENDLKIVGANFFYAQHKKQ